MQNRPSATELLDAVRDLIASDILPTITDEGLRFKALIAANVLAIVGRELSNSDPLIAAELEGLNSLLPDVDLDLTQPASETILTMNRLLAEKIRQAPADSDLIAVGGPAWNHLKQTLEAQLSIASPKFDVSR